MKVTIMILLLALIAITYAYQRGEHQRRLGFPRGQNSFGHKYIGRRNFNPNGRSNVLKVRGGNVQKSERKKGDGNDKKMTFETVVSAANQSSGIRPKQASLYEFACGDTVILTPDDIGYIFIPGGFYKSKCKMSFETDEGNILYFYCFLALSEDQRCNRESIKMADKSGGVQEKFCEEGEYYFESVSNSVKFTHKRKEVISGGGFCFASAFVDDTASTTTVSSTTSISTTSGATVNTTSGTTVNTTSGSTVNTTSGSTVNTTSGPTVVTTPQTCECGESTISASKIVGGADAAVNEYPWQVSLTMIFADGKQAGCGGSILNEEYVLTAAHCIGKEGQETLPTSIIIRYGVHNQDTETGVVERTVTPTGFIVHESYDKTTFNNDIALLKLPEPITLGTVGGRDLKRVCIANAAQTPDTGKSIVTGYGVIQFGTSTTKPLLQEVQLDLIPISQCRSVYGTARITDNMMCTLTIGKDACQGDSGGPLIRQLPSGRWTQVGVVSWGDNCATEFPGVYAKVSQYNDWIQSKSGNAGCIGA